MNDAPVLRLTGLTKRFGALTAVDGVDLAIGAGEVVALLGQNGAGKTTTIDLALGLASPTAGTAQLFGGVPRRAVVDGRVGAMLQGGALLPTTTVRESVALVAAAHRHPLPVDEALERAGVADIAKQKVGRLSGGQLQRARFAVAIVSDPDLLLLDEPTAAMDVEARRSFWGSMRDLTAAGRTVVFATHYLDEADAYADRVVMMRRGRVVADGTPSEVKSIVSGRTVAFSTADAADGLDGWLRALPGVRGLEVRGTRFRVATDAPDATLRAVLDARPDAHDVEVVARSMDDAFLALTADRTTEAEEALR